MVVTESRSIQLPFFMAGDNTSSDAGGAPCALSWASSRETRSASCNCCWYCISANDTLKETKWWWCFNYSLRPPREHPR